MLNTNNKNYIPCNWPAAAGNNNNKLVLYMHYLEYVTKCHIYSNAYNIVFKFKTALFFSFLVVQLFLNNISLLIAQSRLSITQASSSFKCLDTHTFTYATPTFITKALHLVKLVQLF